MSGKGVFSRGYAKRRYDSVLGLRIHKFVTDPNVDNSICRSIHSDFQR